MYQFAIDMGEENSYTPAAPKGVFVARSSLKTEQLAKAGTWFLVFGTLYDPLPTGQLKREKRAEIESDWKAEEQEKGASTARSPLGRIALWSLFATKCYGGWGLWLRNAGRGP